jgi:NAD+ diphosphatase
VSRPALSRAAVDRDAATRDDPAALEAAWASARVLVVSQGTALVDGTDLVLVPAAEAPEGDRLYLGTLDGQAYFAVAADLPRRLGVQARNLREVGSVLSDRDAGLLVHAVALANWHATHTRCPRCGAPTVAAKGGSVRQCTEDGSDHFPRTDPAVIMLVTDGADRCVLGRQPVWPEGRFSTLAGFVEPGESAEMAVVREVAEEVGVAVRDVTYRGSQPWPFPASLMLGFTAVCDPGAEPVAADGELAEARWWTREQVLSASRWDGRQAELMLPPPVSIAHHLITTWADSR